MRPISESKEASSSRSATAWAGRAHCRLQRQNPVPRWCRRAHPRRVRAHGSGDRRQLPLVHRGRRLRRHHDDLRLRLPGARPVTPGRPRPLEPARREVSDRLRPSPDDLPARRAYALRDAGLCRRRLYQLQDLHDRLLRVRQVCAPVPALHGGGRQARRDGQHPLRGPVLHLLHDPEAGGGEQLQRPHLPRFQAAHLGGAGRAPRALDGPHGRCARLSRPPLVPGGAGCAERRARPRPDLLRRRPGRSTSTSRASASTRRSTPSATSAGRRCARPIRWR